MKCRNCGSQMAEVNTDLPFKIGSVSIVIVKDLPVLQCSRCSEYAIEDRVMARVEEMLCLVNKAVELEILRFAA